MVYEMTALLTAYGTTAFLLGEYTEDDILLLPRVRRRGRDRGAVAAPAGQPRRALLPRLQAARQPLPGGRARLPHHQLGARHLPPAGEPADAGGIRAGVRAHLHRRQGAGRDAGRRPVARHDDAAGRPVGRRQDDDRAAVRARGRAAGRAQPVHELPGEPHAAHAHHPRAGRGPRRGAGAGAGPGVRLAGGAADRQHHRRHVPPHPAARRAAAGDRRAGRPGQRRDRPAAPARLPVRAGAALRRQHHHQRAELRDHAATRWPAAACRTP